ncbi:MAG: nitroreductase [Gammaproteobacteria bacterium]|nr:nitroreductase [Gammaproteobacteria bacterium]MDH5176469.1 nitroreductase [Gammaproteobacteria bacterium]MDH5225882.1 nitroreductase [Gammaproteobacteria bacterium]
MNVSDAVASRMSCRAFLDTPVPGATVRSILEAARRTPSGGNVQPWLVYALAGQPLADLKAVVRVEVSKNPLGDGSHEYDIYPPGLGEPYRSRRHKAGEDLYGTLGIPRGDKLARLLQLARNYEFFGAPAGLFFYLDRSMGPPQWSDVGMYMQTVMLLAREQGLHTCAQEIWSRVPATVAKFLDVPHNLLLFAGMALGYADAAHPVNTLHTDRASLEEFSIFKGFDAV